MEILITIRRRLRCIFRITDWKSDRNVNDRVNVSDAIS